MSAINPDREPARRVFAAEYNQADLEFRDGDEEYATRYILIPSGQRVNRLFVVGTLTDKENVGDDQEYWKANIVDPTGKFVVYAGQYQPEAISTIKQTDAPSYVAVVGKVNTFEGESGDLLTSLRPESFTVVDQETRDKWVSETAQRTMERLRNVEGSDIEQAEEHYGERGGTQENVVQALESLEDE